MLIINVDFFSLISLFIMFLWRYTDATYTQRTSLLWMVLWFNIQYSNHTRYAPLKTGSNRSFWISNDKLLLQQIFKLLDPFRWYTHDYGFFYVGARVWKENRNLTKYRPKTAAATIYAHCIQFQRKFQFISIRLAFCFSTDAFSKLWLQTNICMIA